MQEGIVIIASGSVMAANVSGLVSVLKARASQPIAVVLTRSAERFVTADNVRFVGQADWVLTEATPNEGPVPNHVWLARAARPLVVYPASAGFIGRIANGIATDLAATIVAATPPDRVMIFPSMNADMWSNPAVRRNINTLETWGYAVNHSGGGFPLSPDQASALVQRFPDK